MFSVVLDGTHNLKIFAFQHISVNSCLIVKSALESGETGWFCSWVCSMFPGYTTDTFSWATYLKSSRFPAAPKHLFTKTQAAVCNSVFPWWQCFLQPKHIVSKICTMHECNTFDGCML